MTQCLVFIFYLIRVFFFLQFSYNTFEKIFYFIHCNAPGLQWCWFLFSDLFSRPTRWYWNIVLVLTLAKALEAPALFSVQQWTDMLHMRDTALFCQPFEFLSYFLICSKTSSFIRLLVTAGTVAVFNPTLAWHACLVPFPPEELLTWSFMKSWTRGNSHAMNKKCVQLSRQFFSPFVSVVKVVPFLIILFFWSLSDTLFLLIAKTGIHNCV